MKRKPPKPIKATNRMELSSDSRAAAGLFCRILKNVREQTEENRKKREPQK